MKIATLFSGGGVLDAALKSVLGIGADLAVECDPERLTLSTAIADSYELNYPEATLLRSSVQEVCWALHRGDYWLLHGSPSCKNFSTANIDGLEDEGDVAAARGVAGAIEILLPRYFTLEQVKGYVNTVSWQIIIRALKRLNYSISYEVINCSNYGVPQSRERVILIAARDGSVVGMPARSKPTGWGDILGDRVGEMEISQPSKKQQDAVEAHLAKYPHADALLVPRRGYYGTLPPVREKWEPAPTVTSAIFTDQNGADRKTFADIYHEGVWRTLSVRDMAKLQTLPDWYQLPKSNRVAGAIIGNGVPTALYEAVITHIYRHDRR